MLSAFLIHSSGQTATSSSSSRNRSLRAGRALGYPARPGWQSPCPSFRLPAAGPLLMPRGSAALSADQRRAFNLSHAPSPGPSHSLFGLEAQ